MRYKQLLMLSVLASQLVAFTIGYLYARSSMQNANDLLSVGFTIYDPDGCEIEKFDE